LRLDYLGQFVFERAQVVLFVYLSGKFLSVEVHKNGLLILGRSGLLAEEPGKYVHWEGLTLEVSGRRRWAKPAGGCPLDRSVR